MLSSSAIVVPVAAGKGGVGKTQIAANLAIALAQAGNKTVVVDLDLGGSNLHTHLGLRKRYPGLGYYLRARTAALDELLVETSVPGLQFIPGDGRSPFMANIAYQQKLRLIRHLRALEADYLALDLSAGASYNSLDFFAMAPSGLLVTQAEFPSIMNMLSFLKQSMLRRIRAECAKDYRLRRKFDVMTKRATGEQGTLQSVRDELDRLEPGLGARIDALCERCRPRIVVNMVDAPEDLDVATQIDRAAAQSLNLSVDYFGLVFYDRAVKQAIRDGVPLMLQYPDSLAARCIRQIAERVQRFWDRPIDASAMRVRERAAEMQASA